MVNLSELSLLYGSTPTAFDSKKERNDGMPKADVTQMYTQTGETVLRNLAFYVHRNI